MAIIARILSNDLMKTKLPVLLGLLLWVPVIANGATLEVDSGNSRIEVNAKATGHGFTGVLQKYTLKVTGDGSTLAPAALDLRWDFADLKTADEGRDVEMIKWLGGGKPQGSFKFIKTWTDPQGVTYAQGSLTIHGVSKTVAFPYTAKKTGDRLTLDGKVSLDYQNFNLPVVRAMLVMTVDPKLVVGFHIVGKVK
jgi:polyisoprenoid-binding protein YceI